MWGNVRQRRRATAWEQRVSEEAFATGRAAAEAGPPRLRPGALYRGVVGVDPEPRAMGREQLAGLRDPMAVAFFRHGRFPMTVQDMLAGLSEAGLVPAQKVYLVGEAGQIPPEAAPDLPRDLRFVITRAEPGRDPDLLVSTGANVDPALAFLQVAAWDPDSRVFNYYMRVSPAWVWMGDSWSALAPGSRGQNCFDSHVNGSVVMKELKQPWPGWQSMAALIRLAPADPLRQNPLYRQVTGAEGLELTVRALISRWTAARLAEVIGPGTVQHPDHLLRQVFTTTSVNLTSTLAQSAAVTPDGPELPLPPGFWLNTDALLDDLEIPVPETIAPPAVPASLYLDSLTAFDFRIEERTSGFAQQGDTFFAFVVPEAAYEDNDVVRQMTQQGLISARFAACALMVDFPNPVFSPARAHLLKYVPTTATPATTLCETVATAIAEAAAARPAGSPEREFAANWALTEWRREFGERVCAYLEKVSARARTAAGFADYTRLAESRRRDFKTMKLHEFELSLPVTGIPADAPPLRMTEDATVAVRP